MSFVKGNNNSANAADSTEGSPSCTSLFVPPPEQPWTGVELARALNTDPSQSCTHTHKRAHNGKATTTMFPFPFTLPRGSETSRLPSLSSLLPKSIDTEPPADRQWRHQAPQTQHQRNECRDADNPLLGVGRSVVNHSSFVASKNMTRTANVIAATDEAVVLLSSFPLGMIPKSSFLVTSTSGVTQAGPRNADTPAAVNSYSHSLSSASSGSTITNTDTPGAELCPQTSRASAFGEPPGPGEESLGNDKNHDNTISSNNRTVPRSPLQNSTFTDLYVGLERPRLHRLSQQSADSTGSWKTTGSRGKNSTGSHSTNNLKSNNARFNTPFLSSAIESATSNFFSLMQDGASSEASMHDEVDEDDAGAHTPTVYRSSQLPHWWRSIVTPSIGTKVCLRPNTPRLEFWWIDRLGSEAYELIQVILKHSLEGLVMRESGESVVVVEFSIPAKYLGNTSLAVWHPYDPSAAPQKKDSLPLPSAASNTGKENTTVIADELDEEEMMTLEGTAKATAPSPLNLSYGDDVSKENVNDDDPNPLGHSRTTIPIHSKTPRIAEHSAATGTSSTFTVGRHTAERTGTQGTDTSGTLSREALRGLPEFVRADSVHHDPDEHRDNNFVIASNNAMHNTITTPAIAAPTVRATMVGGAIEGAPLLAVPPPHPRTTSVTVLQMPYVSSDGVSQGEETSVPSIHHQRPPNYVLLRPRSSSVDTTGGYSSLSTMDQSNSLVTACGGHSDPFVVERCFCKELPLTRILATTPVHKKAQANLTNALEKGGPGESEKQEELRDMDHLHRLSTKILPAEPLTCGSINPFLQTQVTPGEKYYSPDPSDDCVKDRSLTDRRDSITDGVDAVHSVAPTQTELLQHGGLPLYELPTAVFVRSCVGNPSCQQQLQEHQQGTLQSHNSTEAQQQQQQRKSVCQREATPADGKHSAGSVDDFSDCRGDAPPHVSASFDKDTSFLDVDPLPESEDTSVCLDSVELPTQQSSLRHASSYHDPFPRSKTYGEWLCTDMTTTPSNHLSWSFQGSPAGGTGGGSMGPTGLFAATPPWSHDDPSETTNFLGTTTSVSEMDRVDVLHDDSVLVRLSLPSSVCIPVVAVRLHALQLLHPLLHALTIPHNLPFFTSDSAEDEDEAEEALRAAAYASPFTSDLVNHTAAPDYRTAVQVISDAISREEEHKRFPTTTAPPSVEPSTDDVAAKAAAAAATVADTPVPLSIQPRDLSILYTIRSHLYLHMSPEHLCDSLKDAELALSCCPTHAHVCNTYEVLTACLISFGHTAQVERVSAHLRHRCRMPTPLLTRLGRVTQVMVSYGTLFLRQQLNPALLRHGGITADQAKIPQFFLFTEGVQSSPLDGRAYLNGGSCPGLGGTGGGVSSLSGGGLRGAGSDASATAVPLVVVGGGVVDPPVAGESAVAAPRTLSYEVCPLLLGYYGKSLHRPNDIFDYSYPPQLPPHTGSHSDSPSKAGSAAAELITSGDGRSTTTTNDDVAHCHHRRATRPSNDVCHRRLFLLETLFPSVTPLTAVSKLHAVAPVPRVRTYCGPGNSCSYQSLRRSLAKGGGDIEVAAGAAATAKREKRIKPEDFMYDRDSMFALLASTAETAVPYGTVPMSYFGRHIRLSATRPIPKGETVLLERPALIFALWPLSYPRALRRNASPSSLLRGRTGCNEWKGISGGGGEAVAIPSTRSTSDPTQRRPLPAYCAQCGRQRLTQLFHCPGRCGAAYCTEWCRGEALRHYHIMECRGVANSSPPAGRGADDNNTQVWRAVVALRDIFVEWESFIYHFATWDTPATRCTTPIASCSRSGSVTSSPQENGLGAAASPEPQQKTEQQGENSGGSDGDGLSSRPGQRRSPPPILAITGLRAMSRLIAMMLCLVLPVETLPELRDSNESAIKAWSEERHAAVRAVAQTLRRRGLMVPASTRGSATNMYCSGVDPHRLLLLEVMLQQLSVPFFADFTYRSSSTVWEALNEFPCAVQQKATPNGRTSRSSYASSDRYHYSYGSGGGTKPVHGSHANCTSVPTRSSLFSFAGNGPLKQPAPGRRHWFVELTTPQREEMVCTTHRLLRHMHDVICTELEDVFVLPTSAPTQGGDDDVTAGAPLHWTCPELLGFLSSTRVLEELLDFCLTSCAVMYPQDVEPGTGVAGASNSGSPNPSSHSWANAQNKTTTGVGGAGGGSASVSVNADLRHGDGTPAIPLAVISPWTCLTVDLHPILGHVSGGVIYSRFMIEHEQRRRMIAYCAAAATRRGTGGGNLGASGYGSGLEDDSFLSIHSMASAAVVLSGSVLSPGQEDLGRSSSLRDDWNIQMLEDAASRSCANLHLSLVYSLPSSDTARPPTVAVMMTAKKNIPLGGVLWWESLNFGEYLHSFF